MSSQSTDFLTLDELAALVRVDKRTVVRWRRDGMPCSVSRGAVVRVNLTEVREWLKSGAPIASAKKPARKAGRPRNIDRGMAA